MGTEPGASLLMPPAAWGGCGGGGYNIGDSWGCLHPVVGGWDCMTHRGLVTHGGQVPQSRAGPVMSLKPPHGSSPSVHAVPEKAAVYPPPAPRAERGVNAGVVPVPAPVCTLSPLGPQDQVRGKRPPWQKRGRGPQGAHSLPPPTCPGHPELQPARRAESVQSPD